MRIELLGIGADAERLDQLAQALAMVDPDCTLGFVDVASAPAADTGLPAVQYHCWTTASIGPAGTGLKAHALAAKQAGRPYLGLLFDDVDPPADIAGAQDLRVGAWPAAQPDLTQSPRELLDRIKSMAAGQRETRSLDWDWLRGQLITIRQSLGKYRKWIGGSVVLAAISLLSDMVGLTQWACTSESLTGVCRAAGIGGVPSAAEEADWDRIKAGNSCADLSAFLRRHGTESRLGRIAENRLKFPQTIVDQSRRPINSTLFLETSASAFTSEQLARADVEERARAAAKSLCGDLSQGTGIDAGQVSFDFTQPPQCGVLNGGQRCWAHNVKVTCVINEPVSRQVCPPPEVR